jgi:hypothetical protein
VIDRSFLPGESNSDDFPSELREVWRMLPPPCPLNALQLLYEASCGSTGGRQAARNLLFWLVGKGDPTGYVGCGGIELRRLDRQLTTAALEVLAWWAGPTESDQPVYDVLRKLSVRFAPSTK